MIIGGRLNEMIGCASLVVDLNGRQPGRVNDLNRNLHMVGKRPLSNLVTISYFFLRDFFAGTLPPARRASDKPMAIACLRLLTVLPERPLFNSPLLRSCIARLTFRVAVLPYRAIKSPHGYFLASIRLRSFVKNTEQPLCHRIAELKRSVTGAMSQE